MCIPENRLTCIIMVTCTLWVKEKFEDTKGVRRSRTSKDRQNNDQKDKHWSRKQKIGQHEHHSKNR